MQKDFLGTSLDGDNTIFNKSGIFAPPVQPNGIDNPIFAHNPTPSSEFGKHTAATGSAGNLAIAASAIIQPSFTTMTRSLAEEALSSDLGNMPVKARSEVDFHTANDSRIAFIPASPISKSDHLRQQPDKRHIKTDQDHDHISKEASEV